MSSPFEKEREKIPFPEHIFQGMSEKAINRLRANWSGNPDKFLSNLEKDLNIKFAGCDVEKGTVVFHRNTSGEVKNDVSF